MKRADEALYQAKIEGPNRVVYYWHLYYLLRYKF
jgi:hypothetical protein